MLRGYIPINRRIELLRPLPSRLILGFEGGLMQQLCRWLLPSDIVVNKLSWLFCGDLFGLHRRSELVEVLELCPWDVQLWRRFILLELRLRFISSSHRGLFVCLLLGWNGAGIEAVCLYELPWRNLCL